MKKCSIIAVVLLFFITFSYSQVDINVFGGVHSTALKARLGKSFLESEKDEINSFYQNRLLPFVGVQGKYRFSDKFLFNLESQISFKGQKRNEIDYKERSLYFDLIPSVEINVWKGLNFGLGGYIGIKTHSYFSQKLAIYIQEDIRSAWDFGGMASTSYSHNRFTIRVSYFHGLGTVNKRLYNFGGGPSSSLVGKQFRIYQLGLGYRLTST